MKKSTFQRKKEFYSEIGRVARLRHPNLVAVKGCCYDHGDRYIVYEFVVNGPLDKWLHHIPRGGRSLDWTMRMKIATTLAQGIAYVPKTLSWPNLIIYLVNIECILSFLRHISCLLPMTDILCGKAKILQCCTVRDLTNA